MTHGAIPEGGPAFISRYLDVPPGPSTDGIKWGHAASRSTFVPQGVVVTGFETGSIQTIQLAKEWRSLTGAKRKNQYAAGVLLSTDIGFCTSAARNDGEGVKISRPLPMGKVGGSLSGAKMVMPEAGTEQRHGKAPIDCDSNMACLKGEENFPLCKVEKPIADLLFVTATPLPSCRHMRFFGNGAYCTCPVRRELHKRHKV